MCFAVQQRLVAQSIVILGDRYKFTSKSSSQSASIKSSIDNMTLVLCVTLQASYE
jgi:hypothetical protein